MFELRDYQKKGAADCVALLQKYKIAYLVWEVRCGKTFAALQAANDYGAKKVLFMTKKRAVESGTIQNDYDTLKPNFEIQIINNESLHKVTDNDFDLIISDEHHRNSSYPKPNITTKEIKKRFGHLPMIFLSGTPAIESGSQWYHTFWVSNYSPFNNIKSFYKWAEYFTTPAIKFFGNIQVKDYSKSKDEMINPYIEKYLLKYTQKEAGFTSEITEHIIRYDMPTNLQMIVKQLLKDEIIRGKTDNIVANNAAAMMNKVHQIENGTVITESGESHIIDTYKAEFLKQYFRGKKIAIFYYFQKEKELLYKVFGDTVTSDINEFNRTNKHFCIQQISGSEAISLKEADALVYYNFGYSGKNFTQGRDRMTTKDRADNNVYFLLANESINERIYKAVKSKKRYNDKLFSKEYNYGIRK